MSANDLAQGIAFQRDSDPPWQLTMIAIGFAESGGDPNAKGDYLGQPGGNLPEDAADHCWETDGPSGFQCYTSIGLWQINMAWNWPLVSALAQSQDPAQVGRWLEVPENNGEVAEAIYSSQGFGAWSTYNNGSYRQYVDAAQQAFNAYPGSVGGFTPNPGSQPSGGTLGGAAFAAGQALTGLGTSDDWSGSVRVSSQSVQNMATQALGYGQAFRSLAQGS